jgi:hypothetical protein
MWNHAIAAQMARVTVADRLAAAERDHRIRQVRAARVARAAQAARTAHTPAEPMCRPARARAWA